jgi:hypothetical protein
LLAQFPILEEALQAMGVMIWPMVEFHHMVSGNANVDRAALDHRQNRTQDAAYSADIPAIHIGRRGHGKKVSKQFVSPVNQINVHPAPFNFLSAML